MPIYNRFSDNEVKKRKTPRLFLKDKDMVLIICSFTAIFGVLHFKYVQQPINVSPLYLILALIYIAFWLGIAFSAGQRTSKGFIISASIIWGISLVFLVINYLTFKGLSLNTGNVLNTIISYVALLMLFVVVGTVFPLLPGLAVFGFFPKSISANEAEVFSEVLALQLIFICLAFIILIASAFFVGLLYERKKSLLQKKKPPKSPRTDLKE